MSPPEPTVFIVDDDRAVLEALSSLVRSDGLRVSPFASAQAFLAQPRPFSPSCLVLDVRLPEVSGFDLQRALADAGDRIPIIFITGHGDIPMTVRAMKAGAVEFLPKPFTDRELLGAVRLALEADRTRLRERSEIGALEARHQTLTAREHEVMGHVVNGKMNKQIAAALGIAEITIKVHRRHIMQKMQAGSLAELVRMAAKLT